MNLFIITLPEKHWLLNYISIMYALESSVVIKLVQLSKFQIFLLHLTLIEGQLLTI